MLNKSIIMKRISILLVLLVIGLKVKSQGQASLEPLSRYISKNFSSPKFLKLDCNYTYVAMVLESDARGRIVEVRFVNRVDPYLKASFEFIKSYKFDASMKVGRRPILLFVDVYQQDVQRCRTMDPFFTSPAKLTQETVAIVKEQLEKEPRTILEGIVSVPSRTSW